MNFLFRRITSPPKEIMSGQSVPRAGAKKLLEGRGTYLDDIRLPRLVHVVYFRSPHAHARIKHLDLSQARKQPGVVAVFDGHDVAQFCTPWVGVLGHLKGIRSAPQYAIAPERACWQGEAVAAIVAQHAGKQKTLWTMWWRIGMYCLP
jgi:carbon-monoxide dehydrogenase large subunit